MIHFFRRPALSQDPGGELIRAISQGERDVAVTRKPRYIGTGQAGSRPLVFFSRST